MASFFSLNQSLHAAGLVSLQPGTYYVDKLKGGAKVKKGDYNSYEFEIYLSDGLHATTWGMECWATEQALLCPQEYEDYEGNQCRGDIKVVPLSDESFKIHLPPNAQSWMCGVSLCFGNEDYDWEYNPHYKKVHSEKSKENQQRIAEIRKELENAKK